MRGTKNVIEMRNLAMTVNQLVQGRSNATSYSQPEADEDGIITVNDTDPNWVPGATPSDPDVYRINDPTCSKGSTVILEPADFTTQVLAGAFIIGDVEDGYFEVYRIPAELTYARGQLAADENVEVFVDSTVETLSADIFEHETHMTADLAGGRIITQAFGTHKWTASISLWDLGAGNNQEVELGIVALDTDANGNAVIGSFYYVAASSIGGQASAFDTATFGGSGFASLEPGQSIAPIMLSTFSGTCTFDYIVTLETAGARPINPETADIRFRYAIQGP